MKIEDIQIGDVVRLNSGGPRMTVESMGAGGDVNCSWSTDDHNGVARTRFPAVCLKLVEGAVRPEPDSAAPGGSMITFADFVQHGRDNGANIVNGMPWSWTYNGHAVSHENDQCYLVGCPSLHFTPDDVLRTDSMGKLSVEPLAMRPTYFVKHPDDSVSVADPQP